MNGMEGTREKESRVNLMFLAKATGRTEWAISRDGQDFSRFAVVGAATCSREPGAEL